MFFLQKQAEREHALSSMPGEMPFCKKDKLKENVLCQVCLVKCRFAKTSSCQVCLVKCRFAKTSSKRTCLEPQKGLSWLRKCQGQNADQGGVETHRHPIATWYMTLKWKVIFTTYLTLFLHICDALPPGPPKLAEITSAIAYRLAFVITYLYLYLHTIWLVPQSTWRILRMQKSASSSGLSYQARSIFRLPFSSCFHLGNAWILELGTLWKSALQKPLQAPSQPWHSQSIQYSLDFKCIQPCFARQSIDVYVILCLWMSKVHGWIWINVTRASVSSAVAVGFPRTDWTGLAEANDWKSMVLWKRCMWNAKVQSSALPGLHKAPAFGWPRMGRKVVVASHANSRGSHLHSCPDPWKCNQHAPYRVEKHWGNERGNKFENAVECPGDLWRLRSWRKIKSEKVRLRSAD